MQVVAVFADPGEQVETADGGRERGGDGSTDAMAVDELAAQVSAGAGGHLGGTKGSPVARGPRPSTSWSRASRAGRAPTMRPVTPHIPGWSPCNTTSWICSNFSTPDGLRFPDRHRSKLGLNPLPSARGRRSPCWLKKSQWTR